ncbi:hypothetical protein M405DRAFT_826925 [Rhizopogon salebrosus TDB-379]|nr:hypothetical protein M405DRAFT_826925 [Rhizopogon salebrosus TDB-379]
MFLCKLPPLGKYNKARPQTPQTPLPFEPREEMVVPENLEYMVESVIPRIRSSREMHSPVLACICESVRS